MAVNLLLSYEPTPAVLIAAAAAVVAGAPLFSGGLRAFRLRRMLRRLEAARLAEAPTGFVHLSGRVALDSPLFAPLSRTPCAGYTLEWIAEAGGLVRSSAEHRSFRIVDGHGTARVRGAGTTWDVTPTAERRITATEPISQHLASLLARVPEAAWWRRTGGTLTLVERALADGATVHVIGTSRQSRPLELAEEDNVVRMHTGTGPDIVVPAPFAPLSDADVWVGRGEHLDFLWVGDHAPDAKRLTVAWWRTLGLCCGPALGLAGLLVLAHAVDRLRELGRF